MIPRSFPLAALVLLAGCPRDTPPPVPAADAGDAGDGLVSDGSLCGDTCLHLVRCEQPGSPTEAYEACLVECSAGSNEERLTCLREASCEGFSTCFEANDADRCLQLAQRRDECGDQSTFGESFTCRGLSSTALDCLAQATCEEAAACIEAETAPCETYCDKLTDCLGDDLSRESCLEDCLEDSDDTLRACVAAAACEDLDPCFGSPDLCAQSCGILNACDQIEPEGIDSCIRQCGDSWPVEAVACVRSSDCERLGACGDLP